MSEALAEDRLFGQIVVKNRLATGEVVDRILGQLAELQKSGVSTMTVGEMFVMEGFLTQKQVDAIEDLRRMLVRSQATKKVGGYVLKRKIGEGGMGQVYEALQPALDRKVAVKILPRELVDDPAMVKRFEREAKAAAALSHENIIPVYDFGRIGDEYFLVMEFVDGKNLEEIAEQRGRIGERSALKITKQVARALRYAHARGLTHRDLKPNNIMITKEGKAKLADLGLAKRLDGKAGHITQTGVIVGTPAFMAPEQITNPKGVDLRTDIYGLGVTLFCIVSGGSPFETRTTMEVVHDLVEGRSAIPDEMPGISPPVQALIRKMTAPAPEDRYPDAEAVLAAIEAVEGLLDAPAPATDGTGAERPDTMESSALLQQLVPGGAARTWWILGGLAAAAAVLAVLLWLAL